MDKEAKIKVLSDEIMSRRAEILKIEADIKVFTKMIEDVDNVIITEDSIDYQPKETNEKG